MGVLANLIQSKWPAGSLEAAVNSCVEDLLSRAKSTDWPIDLTAVASELNVAKIDVAGIPCDGMLMPLPGGAYRVMLSRYASPERQRFSLAHELGHAMLFALDDSLRGWATRSVFSPIGCEEEERLCDMLASRLLMPDSLMRSFCARYDEGLASIVELSRVADVSISAAAYRWMDFASRKGSLASFALHDRRLWVSRVLAQRCARSSRMQSRKLFKKNCALEREVRTGSKTGSVTDWVPVSFNSWILRQVSYRVWKQSAAGALGIIWATQTSDSRNGVLNEGQ